MGDVGGRLKSALDALATPDLRQTIEERIDDAGREPQLIPQAPVQPMRGRVAAAVVAFAVFGAAVAFAWSALRPSGHRGPLAPEPDTMVVTLTEPHRNPPRDFPSATLNVGERSQQGQITGFEWCEDDTCRIFNTATPQLDEFVPVPAGSELVVRGTATSVEGHLGDPRHYP